MSFWEKLFGSPEKQKPSTPETKATPSAASAQAAKQPPSSHKAPLEPVTLYSKTHPAAKEIAEAEQAASERLKVSAADYGTVASLNTGDHAHIKAILDRALEKAPYDPDLLYARASLHYLFLESIR